MSEEEQGGGGEFHADFGALPSEEPEDEEPASSGGADDDDDSPPAENGGRKNAEEQAAGMDADAVADKFQSMDVKGNAADDREDGKEEESSAEKGAGGGDDQPADTSTQGDTHPEANEGAPPSTGTTRPSTTGSTAPTRSPSEPAPITDASRTTSLSKLRAYEAARRVAYRTKLASSSLYWRSFRELLHSSIEETERAEQIFKSSAESNTAYAISLRAAHNDTLDDQGHPVVDPKKRKKLLESREKRRVAASAGPGGTSSSSTLAASEEASKSAKSKLYVSEKSFERHADKGHGILNALIESQGIMADRFAEYAKYVYDEAVPEIVEIRQALVLEVTMMERLGDAIQEELDAAEKEVHDAWNSYYNSAEKSLSFANTRDMRRGAVIADANGGDAVRVGIVNNCADVWVEEMRYRMSVAFLSTAWDKSSKELASLFGTLKSTECSRRFRLRELLIAFLNRQERLWLSLPAILTPVMQDLVDKPLDRESIESEVQTSIKARAQGMQKEEARSKKLTGQKEVVGPGLKGIDPSKGNYNLTSPLVSDLLVKANVIEKKSSGMMSSWKTTLAIVTADSFLHLFEIPSSAKVSNGSAPEVAFHALVPPVDVPNAESAKTNVPGKVIKDWFKMLHPAASLALPNCTITFKDESDTCSFEITEKVTNTGATSMMMGKTTTRKVSLRTLSNDETKEWIAAIKANK